MTQNKTANEITCDFIKTTAQALGLDLTLEDKSWSVFIDKKTGHKICVSKTKGDAPKVDTTVDIRGLEGVEDRDGKNGRFVSLFVASKDLIEAALMQMASPDSGNLRPVKRASKKAPVAFRLAGTEEAKQESGPGSAGLHPLSGLEA